MNAKSTAKQQMRFNKGAKVEVAQTGIVGVVKEGYFLREGSRNVEAYSIAVEMDPYNALRLPKARKLEEDEVAVDIAEPVIESFYGSTLVSV